MFYVRLNYSCKLTRIAYNFRRMKYCKLQHYVKVMLVYGSPIVETASTQIQKQVIPLLILACFSQAKERKEYDDDDDTHILKALNFIFPFEIISDFVLQNVQCMLAVSTIQCPLFNVCGHQYRLAIASPRDLITI